jgi:hypothetical protein
MTSLRKFALGALLTVSAFSAVTMTSCKKDDDETNPLLGTYSVVESCGGSYTQSITQSASATSSIQFSNLGNFTDPAVVTASYSKNSNGTYSVAFTNAADASGRKFTGTGLTTDNTNKILNVSYTVTYTDNTTESCTSVMSKN